jgi:hypothetical protein
VASQDGFIYMELFIQKAWSYLERPGGQPETADIRLHKVSGLHFSQFKSRSINTKNMFHNNSILLEVKHLD